MIQILIRGLLWIVFLQTSVAWGVDRYTIQQIDLPATQDCSTSRVSYGNPILFLNDNGQVAGPLGSCTFFWSQGIATVLGEQKPDTESRVAALNNNGQVVLNSTQYDAAGNALGIHALLWDKGNIQNLGALGIGLDGNRFTRAYGMNASGQVVGGSTLYDTEGKTKTHAFLWSNGSIVDLVAGTEYENYNSTAPSINDHGQVVLNSSFNLSITLERDVTNNSLAIFKVMEGSRPLIWQNGILTELNYKTFTFKESYSEAGRDFDYDGVYYGIINALDVNYLFFGEAYYINNAGTVLGRLRNYNPFTDDGTYFEPVLWWSDRTYQTIENGYSYCCFNSEHLKINSLNQVVMAHPYFSAIGGYFPLVSFDNLSFQRILGMGQWNHSYSTSIVINDKGQVVLSGKYEDYSQGFFKYLSKAFIYQDGVVFDLTDLIPATSGWTVEQIYSINNAGQILVSGNKGYALLTPGAPLQTGVCDVNQDGKVNINDLSVLYTAQKNVSAAYDVNGDGVVNVNDLRKCVAQCTSPKCAI